MKHLLLAAKKIFLLALHEFGRASRRATLFFQRCECELMPPNGTVARSGYKIKFNDPLNFYNSYKDIFYRRIYDFETQNDQPLILDCGSNIGISVLYFKTKYPRSKIIAFEPDPACYQILVENIAHNLVSGVETVQAAVSDGAGLAELYADGLYASSLVESPEEKKTAVQVPCVTLEKYLRQDTVELLKLNVEGMEWRILYSCRAELSRVNQLIIEYHHLPDLPRTLHLILQLLHELGYETLVHDFDEESGPTSKPPFRLTSDSQYFLLIYASRVAR